MSDVAWWVWILLGVGLWFLQLIVSAYSDDTIRENKHTGGFSIFRGVLIAGMVVSVLIAVIRFVKLVWNS